MSTSLNQAIRTLPRPPPLGSVVDTISSGRSVLGAPSRSHRPSGPLPPLAGELLSFCLLSPASCPLTCSLLSACAGRTAMSGREVDANEIGGPCVPSSGISSGWSMRLSISLVFLLGIGKAVLRLLTLISPCSSAFPSPLPPGLASYVVG